MDRASTFADPEVVDLLRTRFVPVALDVWYEQRRADPTGDFYRKVVLQRTGTTLEGTTQGFYLFTADGTLLRGWNNRDTEKVRRYLREALAAPALDADAEVAALDSRADARFARALPEGAVVVETFARVLEASDASRGAPDDDGWAEVARASIGRDHLWILGDEITALRAGRFPERLARRLARFHLLDSTRGEPAPWPADAVKLARVDLAPDGRVTGRVELDDDHEGGRAYAADVLGWIALDEAGALTRFDLVVLGEARGASTYTKSYAPEGAFTLAVATRLATGPARVPPQHARDVREYLTAR